VYFTSETQYGSAVDFAKHAARRKGGRPHVYRVEPTGDVERDPDFAVTGGGFRTRQPLRVIEEDDLWKTDPRWAGPAEPGNEDQARHGPARTRATRGPACSSSPQEHTGHEGQESLRVTPGGPANGPEPAADRAEGPEL
jgi:hypothetical protein